MLTNSNKYLSQILVKGVKREYTLVLNWLKDVYNGYKHFSKLIKNEESQNSVQMVLNSLKGGLYSKNIEVVTSTAILMSKMALEFNEYELTQQTWDWFTGNDGGVYGVLYMLRSQSDTESLAVELFLELGKKSWKDLFTQIIKKSLGDSFDYFGLVISLIESLAASIQRENSDMMEPVIEYWIDQGCYLADNDRKQSDENRAKGLKLLSELWRFFPEGVENKPEVANYVLTIFKRATRDTNAALQLFALVHLFNLMEIFASAKRAYAPVIYKALTFSLVENHQNEEIRQFIMSNLGTIYKLIPGVPVGILIDPLVKEIQLSENSSYNFNLFDFEFFQILAKSPKLNVSNGILLLDVQAKVIFNTPIYGAVASLPFLTILQKLSTSSEIQTFSVKFVQVTYLFTILHRKHSTQSLQICKK